MARTTAKRGAKPVRISGGHKLLATSYRLLSFNWRFLAKVIAIVLIVNLVLRFASSGNTASLYQGVWFGFASCALIWSLRHHQAKKLRLSQAFWTGTAPALKFFIIVSLVGLVSLPFSIGSFVFSTINYLAAGTSPVALIVAGGIWIVLGILSLLLLARLVPALIVVTLPEIGPGAALKTSWRLSKGQTFVVAARLLVLFVYIIAALLLFSLVAGQLPLSDNLAQGLTEIFGVGLVLPLLYAFIFSLYKELA